MAIPEKKTQQIESTEQEKEIDPVTFLFEDDDEDEDTSNLPPERNADKDTFDDDDW